ncbi:hypothetical protein N0V90_013452 [Kalmusia sp. IMI 367209]|nr:hypothetical protein N0V90_013452 [Kalmusia sp. IMI 367209]
MTNHVRVSRNTVNLGNLYGQSLYVQPLKRRPSHGQPWRRPPQNSVNLGKLFAQPRCKQPPSWAYFEDGSVYLEQRRYMDHNELEAEMRLLQSFVRQPTPDLVQTRYENPKLKRRILLHLMTGTNSQYAETHAIAARNADDGERVTLEMRPFIRVDIIRENLDRDLMARFWARWRKNPRIPREVSRAKRRNAAPVRDYKEEMKTDISASTQESPRKNTEPLAPSSSRSIPRPVHLYRKPPDMKKRETQLNQKEPQLFHSQQELLVRFMEKSGRKKTRSKRPSFQARKSERRSRSNREFAEIEAKEPEESFSESVDEFFAAKSPEATSTDRDASSDLEFLKPFRQRTRIQFLRRKS